MSPVVPTIGGAGSYRTMPSPEAKCAMTSPSPGRLPRGGRPAASHASAVELRRARWGAVRPPDLVEVGVPLCVGLGRVHQATAILLVDGHLLGKQKPGTQPRRLSAQREDGGHAASVPDPAGRDHRHRCHRVHDGGHQGKRRDLTPHVPPGLPTLGHDDINSAGDCPPRLFGAADRVQNDSIGVVDLLDVAGGIPQNSDTIRKPASRASSRRRC